MRILVNKGIPLRYIQIIRNVLYKHGLQTKFHYFTFNKKTIRLRELSRWVERRVKEKTLIISNLKIQNTNFNSAVEYKGISNKIDGNLALVKFDENQRLPLISLHEALHLMGLEHCNERACMMGLKLCNGRIMYCVLCKAPCKELSLCKKCDDLWKRKKLN